MPLYEYYCDSCNGVYEAIRPMREASLAVPCPECDRDGQRVMSSFNAFSFREGYPRRLPDKGTYWHYGQQVKKRASRMEGTVHPELARPKPQRKLTKGEVSDGWDRMGDLYVEGRRRAKEGMDITGARLPKARKAKTPRTTLTPDGKIEEPSQAAPPPILEGKKRTKLTPTGRSEGKKGWDD